MSSAWLATVFGLRRARSPRAQAGSDRSRTRYGVNEAPGLCGIGLPRWQHPIRGRGAARSWVGPAIGHGGYRQDVEVNGITSTSNPRGRAADDPAARRARVRGDVRAGPSHAGRTPPGHRRRPARSRPHRRHRPTAAFGSAPERALTSAACGRGGRSATSGSSAGGRPRFLRWQAAFRRSRARPLRRPGSPRGPEMRSGSP
jgi:hypothetical protein